VTSTIATSATNAPNQTITGRELITWLEEWDPQPGDYIKHSMERLAQTFRCIPAGQGNVLELANDNHFSLLLSQLTSYKIYAQNLAQPLAGDADDRGQKIATFTRRSSGDVVRIERDLFDAEKERFPYPDAHFSGALCCEVLEHFVYDPAAVPTETHRVLQPGGWLLLTTPNLVSWHAIRCAVQGMHPLEHSRYFRTGSLPIQHTREYAPHEVAWLLGCCGFQVERMTTYRFHQAERLGPPEWFLVAALTLYNLMKLRHPRHLRPSLRRPHLFVLARKISAPRERYPGFLYV
jgi:SAM-dependent methyltransferase